jgi:hypothetical protein
MSFISARLIQIHIFFNKPIVLENELHGPSRASIRDAHENPNIDAVLRQIKTLRQNPITE